MSEENNGQSKLKLPVRRIREAARSGNSRALRIIAIMKFFRWLKRHGFTGKAASERVKALPK